MWGNFCQKGSYSFSNISSSHVYMTATSLKNSLHTLSAAKFFQIQYILFHWESKEVYRQMLGCTCKNLPVIYEAAERKGENLVIEEFVEGDTLDFLLKGAIFSPRETRQIIRQLCQGLWVLHSMAAVHRTFVFSPYSAAIR